MSTNERRSPSEWDRVDELLIAAGYVDPDAPRESFEEYLHERGEIHGEIAYYAEHGSWRSGERVRGSEIDAPCHIESNNCYYNAQTSLLPEYLRYTEGYVVGDYGKQGRHAIPHAWLERVGDDAVVELTPNISPDKSEYFGIPFNQSDVTEVMVELGQADPIVEAILEGVIDDPIDPTE